VISHPDNDHHGGTASLLQAFQVKEILTSVPCQAGQHWQWDQVEFRILHPSVQEFKPNNQSCLLKISTQGGRLLLTGDIEKTAESYLVNHYSNELSADVLIVPHHGSRFSSSESFIDAVKPQIALFSTGYRNRFHHPHPEVLQRYQRRHIRLWNTASHGSISLRLTADGISQPTLAREQMRRYWHE